MAGLRREAAGLMCGERHDACLTCRPCPSQFALLRPPRHALLRLLGLLRAPETAQ